LINLPNRLSGLAADWQVNSNWSKGLVCHDRKGTPINFPGQATNRIPYGGIMNFMERTMAVPKADEIYVALPPEYRLSEAQKKEQERALAGKKPSYRCSVDVLGYDGRTKRTVIWQCTHGVVVRVDRQGTDPERARHMHEMLKAWQREVAARIPEPNPAYESKLVKPRISNNAKE
jgi:hypothetical protein